LIEHHLKRILREFLTYYNRRRPHSALGPGFPKRIWCPSQLDDVLTTWFDLSGGVFAGAFPWTGSPRLGFGKT
jgi:hypothetical protein